MFFRIIVYLLTISLFSASPAFCAKSGGVEYHDYLFDYSNLDAEPLRIEAESLLARARDEADVDVKNDLLHQAMKDYYILLKIIPDDVDALNKRGLIYDIQDRNILAKSFFSRSLNIEKDNPDTNFLVGNYFYKRRDFKRALRYYTTAYENGYRNYDINFKLAVIYEKLGDLCNAKHYYEQAYALDSSQTFLLEKIESIPEENAEYHGVIRS